MDLTVRAGEHWALIGPNGAGRSRVLSMCGVVERAVRAVDGRSGQPELHTRRDLSHRPGSCHLG
ncbi:ATP-binding cassette domain-containing protein [Oerskovia rustica]|uniref:ATP-binding cassette domain-containing protein n=1 Tax=Oerskovia rustica TaxID=2762237 RepID=UPI00296B0883|nr:ATP-binding cassette domain-containing protein [Oerskovia rustica]